MNRDACNIQHTNSTMLERDQKIKCFFLAFFSLLPLEKAFFLDFCCSFLFFFSTSTVRMHCSYYFCHLSRDSACESSSPFLFTQPPFLSCLACWWPFGQLFQRLSNLSEWKVDFSETVGKYPLLISSLSLYKCSQLGCNEIRILVKMSRFNLNGWIRWS